MLHGGYIDLQCLSQMYELTYHPPALTFKLMISRWIFQVLVIAGRDYITLQYIPDIQAVYTANWVIICYLSPTFSLRSWKICWQFDTFQVYFRVSNINISQYSRIASWKCPSCFPFGWEIRWRYPPLEGSHCWPFMLGKFKRCSAGLVERNSERLKLCWV